MAKIDSTPTTAHLPNGDQLLYWDSGPVPNSDDFATVVVIHGMAFNGYGFLHLLPLAPEQNLRLVIVQRRDYEGSSRYTDQEMKFLSENPETFFKEMGVLMMYFVHYLVANTHICKPTKDRLGGGISVLGWSLGGIPAMSMFTEHGMVDKEAYALIEPYVTHLILYDPAHVTLGIQFSDMTNASDKLASDSEVEAPKAVHDPEKFPLWVSSYFDQPLEWDISKIDIRPHTEKATSNSWSKDEQERLMEIFPLRSDNIIVAPHAQVEVRRLADSVLHNTDPECRAFPRIQIAYIYCQRSPWTMTLGWAATRKKRKELVSKGHGSNLRPIEFRAVEWGNHFTHSDYPAEFMGILSEVTRNQSQV